MVEKGWREEVEEYVTHQTERARFWTKYLRRAIPISGLIGLLAAYAIIQVWGVKELTRMLLQVVLTLTLGATIFASLFRRLDKMVEDEDA